MADPAIEYKNLSVQERIRLVEDIWDSIAQDAAPIPLSESDIAELHKRSAEHKADPQSAIPSEEVLKELYDSNP